MIATAGGPVAGATIFTVLAVLVLALGVIVAAVCLSLMIHHLVSSHRRLRHAARMRRAATLLAPYLVGGNDLPQAVGEARKRLGDRAVADVLRRARTEIKGPRAAAISEALAEMGEVDRLKGIAASRRAWKRMAAIRGLGECGGDEAQQLLLSAVRDPDPVVRRAARDGLLADGRPDSIQAAIGSFLEDVPKRSGWRREFYARMATMASPALLEETVAGRFPPAEEKLAMEALGDVREMRVMSHARARLSASDPEIRATAARVLGKLGDTGSVPALINLLDDSEWYVRASAARALEFIPVDEPALDALGKRLSDSVWWVRADAALSLAGQGEAGANVLITVMEGEDKYARDTAMAAIARTGLTPATRRRLRDILPKLTADPEAASSLAILQAAPGVLR